MKNKISLFLLLLLSGCSKSIQMIDTPKVYKTQSLNFSQAVEYNGLLFTSGQVGWDTNYQLTKDITFKDQLEKSFMNVQEILDATDSQFKDVLIMRIYVKELDNSKRDEVGRLLAKYYPLNYKPASSLIGVAKLAREDLLVEVEIIAKTK